MSSSSCESSDSESSGFSYRSASSTDDLCLLNRSNSSSDSDKECPVAGFTEEDRDEIVSSVRKLSAGCGIVFPKDSPPPCDKLKQLPWSLSIVSESMKHLLQLAEVRSKPSSVLWDACVFSDRRPLMILTFVSTSSREAALYNSSLAREIMKRLNNDMKSYLTCTHGLVETSHLSSETSFSARISELREQHRLFAVPITLQMSAVRCSSMLKYVMGMMQRSSSRSVSISSIEEEDLLSSDVLTLEEKNDILRFPSICQVEGNILPRKVWTHLKDSMKFPELCKYIEEVVWKSHRLMIVQLPRSKLLKFEEEPLKENNDIPELLFDIFAIDFKNPMMVLTFAEESTQAVVDHNYDIALKIQKNMKKDIEVFSCFKGVVVKTDAQTQKHFESRIHKIKSRDLSFVDENKFAMDAPKSHSVVKSLSKLMPAVKDYSSKLIEEKNTPQLIVRNYLEGGSEDMGDRCSSSIGMLLETLPYDIKLVVIGKEGVGKSSTCNTILGEEIFPFKDQSEVPSVVRKKLSEYRRMMEIKDTMGCGEDFTPVVNGLNDIHAVVVVLRREDIDEKDHQIYTNMMREFGKKVFDFTIVIITEDGRSNGEYMSAKSSSPDQVALLNKFGNRKVSFDNKADGEQKKDMLKNFMSVLTEMVQKIGEKTFCPRLLL